MGAVTAATSPPRGRPCEAIARRTPVLSSRTISERAGGVVVLKAENLQRTGSFKIRGAAAKLAALGDGCAAGVVAASAGNHAQSAGGGGRARAACRCEVFVPGDAPLAKVEAARGQGAIVHVGGDSVDACLERRAASARATAGLAFVHPFDDPHIVAGQGSLGLELLEDVPDLAKVVVPVGGGGLCSGVAIAIKSARPEVEVVGVQVAACAPYPESLGAASRSPATSALTIADGIAVKRPGDLTLRCSPSTPTTIVVVDEDATAEAMVLLMERCKLVVEGAGAVGVAALLGGQVRAGRAGHDGRGPVAAATSTRACSPRSPAAHETRGRPPARPAHPRARPPRATSRGCSPASPTRARTSSTSRTCARGSTCTCARPRSSS